MFWFKLWIGIWSDFSPSSLPLEIIVEWLTKSPRLITQQPNAPGQVSKQKISQRSKKPGVVVVWSCKFSNKKSPLSPNRWENAQLCTCHSWVEKVSEKWPGVQSKVIVYMIGNWCCSMSINKVFPSENLHSEYPVVYIVNMSGAWKHLY